MGRQSRSVSAWILVVRPPRERPIAWLLSPLFRPRPSGAPSTSTSNERLRRGIAGVRQGLEELNSDALVAQRT